ncbi:hypothetical protein K438DRAFT_1976109 [Mycena galopus ATCC 62051]|nr:hypothetical protein K438DRAFT_1976109 [Mycena galopus ATCC 62051]
MSLSSTPLPIPTALVAPILDGYISAIREPLAFLLVSAVFGSILFPLLLLLFAVSTPQTRRKPIFILNVFSVALGIVAAGMNAHLALKPILAPFQAVNLTEGLVFTIIDVWMPWIAEAILLVRIAIVFSRSELPMLLAFPVAIKIGRAVISIIFTVRWIKLTLAGISSQFAVTEDLGRALFKAGFFLELFDNAYVSSLFLWRLRWQSRPSFVEGSAIQRVPGRNEKQSYTDKLQRLFWITSTNFIFPLIFGLIRIITTFVATNATLYAVIYAVNAYVAIIFTVFATIWSSTMSLKEAIQGDSGSIVSSRPVVFHRNETIGTTASAPPLHTENSAGHKKTEAWDEPK